jgi:hypothetical protein
LSVAGSCAGRLTPRLANVAVLEVRPSRLAPGHRAEHEEWLLLLRAEGWEPEWYSRGGTPIELNGRMAVRHAMKRWAGRPEDKPRPPMSSRTVSRCPTGHREPAGCRQRPPALLCGHSQGRSCTTAPVRCNISVSSTGSTAGATLAAWDATCAGSRWTPPSTSGRPWCRRSPSSRSQPRCESSPFCGCRAASDSGG